MGRAKTVALLLWITACAPSAPGGGPTGAPVPSVPPPSAVSPGGAPACERIVRIEIHKSDRVLRAFCAGGGLIEMTAAMGREPRGDKRLSGDRRTPEGRYHVIGDPADSRFHAFIPLDYPSVDDADRALAEGRISRRDHARIVDAHARGLPPPGDTPLGGDIGLHGEGPRWAGDSEDLNWTFGCVAVSDADLDRLIARIEPGVPVVILP